MIPGKTLELSDSNDLYSTKIKDYCFSAAV